MDAATIEQLVQIAHEVVPDGGGGNPSTIQVGGVSVSVNPFKTGTERGYTLTWVSGKLSYTVKIMGEGPFAKIVPF
jgi:hypothetical protein